MLRTKCERCHKKTTETWDGWCQKCIDDVRAIQEANELTKDEGDKL